MWRALVPLRIALHGIPPTASEVYNLGAQSHVKVSFEMPEFTADTAGMGTLRMLEAVRTADWPIRFYQAGSSRDVRQVVESAADARRRRSTRAARTPIAKVFAHWMTIQYREAYGLHASNGILFNHESPRRGGTFVTRKVTRGDRGDPRRRGGARSTSATSTPGATGATRRSTSRRCGGCSSSPSRTTTSIATGEMHTVRELVRGGLRPRRARLGERTSGSTSATSARPRSTSSAATPSKAERVPRLASHGPTFHGARPDHARGATCARRASTRQALAATRSSAVA